jgi:predicted ATPase
MPDWETDPDPVQPVVDRLAGAATVLVLDNCEHVIDAAARLVDELVARTERVWVLATSREALGVSGELVRPVAPLATPAPQVDMRSAELARWPATRLFLDRARDVVPDFPVDSPTAESIAQVCRCLDGLPLAIELAAARMNALTAGQLAVDLGASLRAVGEGPRTAPQRHRTLDAAIAWSYDLLDPLEQTLLGRLSVAPGSWSLEAAQHFAGGEPIAPEGVRQLVPRLVRKSLLVLRIRDGLGRYAMLRVIRLYASERLAAAGEAPVVRERHARYYSALAEQAAAGLRGPDQQLWLARLDAETDNLRAALQYWCDAGAADDSLRTATALWRFAYLRGRYAEGREVLDAALSLADTSGPTNPLLRAGALVAVGTLAYLQCDYDLGGERLRAGLALYRTAGHTAGIADALQRLGSIARERGCYAEAVSLHEEALALRRADGDAVGVGDALNYLAFVAWLRGQPRTTEPLAIQALDYFRHTAPGDGSVWALLNLGIAARYCGALADADRLVRASLELAEHLGYPEGTAWCLDQLGALARARGELPIAWDLQHESLTLHAQLGDRWRAASVLEGLAVTAAAREQYRTAARLAGFAQSMRAAIGTPRPPCDDAEYDAAIATAAATLGPDEYANHARITRPQRLLTRLAETTNLTAALRAIVGEDSA